MDLWKRRDGQGGAERIRRAASACSASGEAGGVFEPLERRQFLSVTIGDAPGCDAKTLIYNDPDGTLITVSLKGGSAKFSWTGDFIPDITRGVARFIDMPTIIDAIELAGTNLRSVLSFKTSIPRGADEGVDNLCSVGTITSGLGVGGLGKIVGPNLVIEGDVVVSGRLDQASFHDLGDSETSPPTQLTAESVGNIMLVGGYLNSDVTATAGSIGNITIKNGGLYGSLFADNGSIGNITVTGVVVYESLDDGSVTGGVPGGEIASPEIRAGHNIGKISSTGGGITDSVITAGGDIGAITATGLLYKAEVGWIDGLPGRTTSWDYEKADVSATITAGGILGKIKVTGGDFSGQYDARTVKGVSTQAVLVRKRDQVGAYGGDITATVDAFESLGLISAKGVKANAKGTWRRDPDTGERYFDQNSPGGTLGGTIDLTLWLGLKQPDVGEFEVNEALTCKNLNIVSIGGSVTLGGGVSFVFTDASIHSTVKITPLSYIYSYDDFNLSHPPHDASGIHVR